MVVLSHVQRQEPKEYFFPWGSEERSLLENNCSVVVALVELTAAHGDILYLAGLFLITMEKHLIASSEPLTKQN